MYDVKIQCTGDATLVIPMSEKALRWCYTHLKDVPKLQPEVWRLDPGMREKIIEAFPKTWVIWQ